VEEHLLYKWEALSSNSIPTKEKKKRVQKWVIFPRANWIHKQKLKGSLWYHHYLNDTGFWAIIMYQSYDRCFNTCVIIFTNIPTRWVLWSLVSRETKVQRDQPADTRRTSFMPCGTYHSSRDLGVPWQLSWPAWRVPGSAGVNVLPHWWDSSEVCSILFPRSQRPLSGRWSNLLANTQG
jgi:hypothetical protein